VKELIIRQWIMYACLVKLATREWRESATFDSRCYRSCYNLVTILQIPHSRDGKKSGYPF